MMPRPITAKVIQDEVAKANIQMLGTFTGIYDSIKFQCVKCNHEWDGQPCKVRFYKCCPECRKAYVESPYGQDMIPPIRQYVKSRARQLIIIKHLGGKCKDCACDLVEAPWKADFHHIDPTQKEIEIGSILTAHWDSLLQELNKCILLCANCHRQKHYDMEKYNTYLDRIREVEEKLSTGEIMPQHGLPPGKRISCAINK